MTTREVVGIGLLINDFPPNLLVVLRHDWSLAAVLYRINHVKVVYYTNVYYTNVVYYTSARANNLCVVF